MAARNRFVFINCPFDKDYLACFEAIIFTIYMSGYRPECALQDDNFGNVRLDKLKAMIERCDRSIHDLSRTESNARGLPRFNMPFELGLAIGAFKFGGRRQRQKSTFVMVKKPYVMPQFLSDAAGQDPHAHGGQVSEVIKLVRSHLGTYYQPNAQGERLPGPRYFNELFREFKKGLPALSRELHLSEKDLDCFRGGYLDYLEMVRRFSIVVEHAGRRS